MSEQKTNNASTSTNPVGKFMVATGGVIELKQTGKILLIQRSSELDWHPNEWEILYGRIDQFETPEAGLRRELKEETGLQDLEIVKLLSVWHIFRGQAEVAENELIGITYHCRTQQEKVILSDEHQSYKWVSAQEALTLVKVDGIKRDVLKFLEHTTAIL